MNKQDIISRLKDFPYSREEYWVITGSAMVLYGIREQTHDIDMGCTSAMADKLPLSEKVMALMLVGFGTLICLTEIPAIIYECWLIRKRRQKNDLAGRFFKASRNIKKDF